MPQHQMCTKRADLGLGQDYGLVPPGVQPSTADDGTPGRGPAVFAHPLG